MGSSLPLIRIPLLLLFGKVEEHNFFFFPAESTSKSRNLQRLVGCTELDSAGV